MSYISKRLLDGINTKLFPTKTEIAELWFSQTLQLNQTKPKKNPSATQMKRHWIYTYKNAESPLPLISFLRLVLIFTWGKIEYIQRMNAIKSAAAAADEAFHSDVIYYLHKTSVHETRGS